MALKNITDRLTDFYFDLITAHTDPYLPKEEKIGNINVFRVGGRLALANFVLPKAIFPLAVFLKGRELIKNNDYGLFFVLQASQAAGAVWILKKLGYIKKPIVINIQEGKNLKTQFLPTRLLRNLIVKTPDHFIVISRYLEDFLLKMGIKKEKISIIPNGVDIGKFKPVSDSLLRQNLNLGDNRVIITISRLVGKNGISDLINAFTIIKDRISNVRLVIVGSGFLENDLREQVRKLDLERSILFLGQINHDKLPEYLSVADVFVRPSLSEGLGTAFLEAMACGVPIIGTSVGGIPDFLKNGYTGLFCNPGDPTDIAEKIIKILNDDELGHRLAENGRKLVEEKYNWEIVAEKFKKIYERI